MSINPNKDLIDIYERVNTNLDTFDPIRIYDFTPVITEKDISYGEITRYFSRPVHQLDASEIQEIDQIMYRLLQSKNFYNVVTVRWTIRGKLEDQFGLTDDGTMVRLYTGVATANRLNVELVNERMPGLKNAVTDYTRFWQGE